MRYYELDFEWDWNYEDDEEAEVWDAYDWKSVLQCWNDD